MAAFDASDKMHAWTVSEMKKLRGRFATVWPAITEACHILSRRGARSQSGLMGALKRSQIEVVELGRNDIVALSMLLEQYADLPMDLADAAVVHVYHRDSFDSVMTLDRRDFTVYRVAGEPIRTIMPGA